MQLDGGLHCQGFGNSINRLKGRATLASNVALSVSSPYPSLSVTVVAAANPTGKKAQGGGWGGGVAMEAASLSHAHKKALTSSPW